MSGIYTLGDIVLGNWKLTRLIGEGSYGRVFEAEREDFGRIYKAAIKIITIPQSQSEIRSVMADGMDQDSVIAYFKGFVEELVDEFSLMSKIKGNSNVVSYEDHTVIPHTDNIGWDIIIRMELLTPLIDYAQKNKLTRKDVIQLGIDMCKALELCQKFNIVHRDIKPENIFVSDMGDFKLGDFGIARTVEKTTSGLSKKGTYAYMAPEIYRGDAYGSSVDLYSLGIVLYRLLNDNRTPFLPDYPAPISHSDREKALAKRISGAEIPPPKNADGRLAEIVLKACAYNPKDRYSSPKQMREELEAILYTRAEAPIIYPQGDEAPVKSVEYIEPSSGSEAAGPAPEVNANATVSIFDESLKTSAKTESILGDTSKTDQTKYSLVNMPEDKPEVKVSISGLPVVRAGIYDEEDDKPDWLTDPSVYERSGVKKKKVFWGIFISILVLFAIVYAVMSYNNSQVYDPYIADNSGQVDTITDNNEQGDTFAESYVLFSGEKFYWDTSSEDKKFILEYAYQGSAQVTDCGINLWDSNGNNETVKNSVYGNKGNTLFW